jgi:uncharacterized membrane protein
MSALIRSVGMGSRAVSYMLGGIALVMAVGAVMTSHSVTEITSWARDVLGWTFVVLLAALVFVALLSWVQMLTRRPVLENEVWLQTGIQAANGVTTLALTFTLLGISLGIGTLASTELTPETIQPVISKMTANFSLAFMTTVVGLPISAVLRSLIVVTHARQWSQASVPTESAQFERLL